jgi:hypothetical protein
VGQRAGNAGRVEAGGGAVVVVVVGATVVVVVGRAVVVVVGAAVVVVGATVVVGAAVVVVGFTVVVGATVVDGAVTVNEPAASFQWYSMLQPGAKTPILTAYVPFAAPAGIVHAVAKDRDRFFTNDWLSQNCWWAFVPFGA